MIISSKELQMNEQIRDSEVRLIDADGSQVGIVTIKKAMSMAAKADLDLVKIADKAEPPVCKIMDYGKYKFDMAKKEKESKKNQRTSSVKEVRISMNIDVNDLNTKVNHARRFAEDGDKIKVSMRLKGREMGHTDIGRSLMMKFADMCADFADLSKPVALEGKSLSMLLVPKSKPTNQSKKSSKKGSEEGKKEAEKVASKPEENVQTQNS